MHFTRSLKLAIKSTAVMAGAAGLTVLTTTPAWAYTQSLDGGKGHAYVSSTKQYIEACDDDADNRGVFAEYNWVGINGRHGEYVVVRDTNGASSPCGSGRPPGAGDEIVSYHVCLRKPGVGDVDYCKPWVAI